MRKKLLQVGSSLAIVIDKQLLELMGLDIGSELEMGYDGQQITLRPIRSAFGHFCIKASAVPNR